MRMFALYNDQFDGGVNLIVKEIPGGIWDTFENKIAERVGVAKDVKALTATLMALPAEFPDVKFMKATVYPTLKPNESKKGRTLQVTNDPVLGQINDGYKLFSPEHFVIDFTGEATAEDKKQLELAVK